MSEIDYEDLQDLVLKLSPEVDVAELDGLVTGLLVRGPSVKAAVLMKCLHSFLTDSEAKEYDAMQQQYLIQLMAPLAEHAQQLHSADGWAWEPLHPDEDKGLSAQVESLSAWCAGFIHGVGIALTTRSGEVLDAELPGDTHEQLADLGEISRADAHDLEGGDAEADYSELFEYVRTVACTCSLELSNWQPKQPTGPASERASAAPAAPTSSQVH